MRRIRDARVAYKKRHKLSDVARALQISKLKGRPKILHRSALRRYVVLYRAHLRQQQLRSVDSKREKELRLSKAQLQALAEVRKEFGYDTDKSALAGLQRARRTAETKGDRRVAV